MSDAWQPNVGEKCILICPTIHDMPVTIRLEADRDGNYVFQYPNETWGLAPINRLRPLAPAPAQGGCEEDPLDEEITMALNAVDPIPASWICAVRGEHCHLTEEGRTGFVALIRGLLDGHAEPLDDDEGELSELDELHCLRDWVYEQARDGCQLSFGDKYDPDALVATYDTVEKIYHAEPPEPAVSHAMACYMRHVAKDYLMRHYRADEGWRVIRFAEQFLPDSAPLRYEDINNDLPYPPARAPRQGGCP